MTSYWVSDIPAAPYVAVLPFDLDTTGITGATGTLSDGNGEPVALVGASFTFSAEDRTVSVAWGSVSRFQTPGLYSFQPRLTGTAGVSVRLAPELIPVQEEDGWHALESARLAWTTGAPSEDPDLHDLLSIARQQVTEYAPELPEGSAVPVNYRRAQLLQARNLWNATLGNDQGEMGPEGFTIPTKPLDMHVRQLLRPKTGMPVIG